MVYVFLASGFEEIEAITVIDMLRRANVEVETVAVGSDLTVEGAHGIEVKADRRISELSYDELPEMAVIPGGASAVERLLFNKDVENYIRAVMTNERVKVAAICAGPSVIGFYGLLNGTRATCYPGFEDRLLGADYTGERVVRDGRFLTAAGPGVSLEFAAAIVAELCGKETARKICDGMMME